jgi:hypothetical protein
MSLSTTSKTRRRATIVALVIIAMLAGGTAMLQLDRDTARGDAPGKPWEALQTPTIGSHVQTPGVQTPPQSPGVQTPPQSPGVQTPPQSPGLQAPAQPTGAGTAPAPGAPAPSPQGNGGAVAKGPGFTISGDLAGALAPGHGAPLELTLSNLGDRDVTVTELAVRLARTTASRCDITLNFRVRQASGDRFPVTLPARTARTLADLGFDEAAKPRVDMVDLPVNQDACKGAVLTLAYSGRAR